ncbi:MAG: Gfo/Idh/MocA family oxidoreductase [Bacteroidales bacterium]|nr:Gfo/Idh/MocA family oxidoreductase [Candidatus Cryptobacteroides onthequi]
MKKIASLFLTVIATVSSISAQTKIGIIGLDTSHSIAFTKLLNDKNSEDRFVREFEVVAAYPYGTRNIESATSRIPKYVDEIQQYGVVVTDSVAELLEQVDCVFLETNDGNLHLEQAVEVFKSGRKIYIDKPLGATLGQAIAIYEVAERYGSTFFSSSAVRFTPQNVKLRNGDYGAIIGADVYSPHSIEPTHPDFGYYGIHGVEELFTVMGTGCKSVSRTHNEAGDVVVGLWEGDRIGSFRAIVKGPYLFGGTAFTASKAYPTGGYSGYKVLLDQILRFFETGESPVSKEETLELFTFMKAANMSLDAGGAPVSMAKARKAGEKDAKKLLKKL